jgi:hypothetical protein
MAGMDQLGWSESTGHRRYSEEEKVAGVQFGAWTREHQERNYGLILPKAADGLLRSLEDDPQEPDVESHLIQALNEKLREMSARPSCPKADAFTPWYDGPISSFRRIGSLNVTFGPWRWPHSRIAVFSIWL